MKRKAPQFLIRYANDKTSRIYDENIKNADEVLNDKLRKVNYAVFDYEYGVIEIDEAMKTIAEI